MKTVDIAVESVTVAIKARKLLRQDGVSARVIKLDEKLAESGCIYGIRINEADFFAAAAALRRASISYRIG